eukprot:SAG22_NODE_938_length_6405_cov_3.226134_3_plen_258_part_00
MTRLTACAAQNSFSFVVKIGDLGLSSVNVPYDVANESASIFGGHTANVAAARLVFAADYSKAEMFYMLDLWEQLEDWLGPKPAQDQLSPWSRIELLVIGHVSVPSWRMLPSFLNVLRRSSHECVLMIGKFIESIALRSGRNFREAWDIGNLMQALKGHPYFFSNHIVQRYAAKNAEQVEKKRARDPATWSSNLAAGRQVAGPWVEDITLHYHYSFPDGYTKFIPRSRSAMITPEDMLMDLQLWQKFRVTAEECASSN